MFIIDLQENPSNQHIPFFEDEDLRVQFEQVPLGPVIHCEVKTKWNKDTLYKSLLVLEEICKEFSERDIENIFALVKADDEKHKKYVGTVGFQYFAQGLSTTNDKYEFWSLNTNEFLEEAE